MHYGRGYTKPASGRQASFGHPLLRDCVGLWLANEGSGLRINDVSGNRNDGTLTGSAWTGGALKLNGSSDYIDCGSGASLDITEEITLSLLLRPSASAEQVYPLVKGDNYGVLVGGGDDKWQFRYKTGGTVHRYSLTAGFTYDVWQHVAITYVSAVAGSAKIYVDGVLGAGSWAKGDGTDALAAVAGSLLIGAWATPEYYYLGEIAVVAIYNRVLSADEIDWLYHEPYAMVRCG